MFGKLDFDWVKGMRGVIPVFSNKRKAEQYARKLGATVHTFDAVRED